MQMRPRDYIYSLEKSIKDLADLSPRLAAPASKPYQRIGSCASSSMVMMSALLNSVYEEEEHRWITFTEEGDWHASMQANFRLFYNSLMIFTEKACAEICETNGMDIEVSRLRQAESIINSLKEAGLNSKKIERKIKFLAGSNASFMDYINSTLSSTELNNEQRLKWINFFRDLSIIRNKASHSVTVLSQGELKSLRNGQLHDLVDVSGELRLSVESFRPIYEMVLSFFDEIESQGRTFQN